MKFNLLFLAIISGVTSSHASAETGADTKIRIGEIIEVTGHSKKQLSPEVVGSVDVIGRDQLENEHVNITMDLFKKVPGVYFSRFNQGVVSADIAIRGFNGEGSLPHTKLLIDGVPSNLHNGLSEMDALFPLEISQVEVVKGTNDPRYGLHNLAGNYHMTSRRDVDVNQVELLLGSFNTKEAQAYVSRESGDFSQHYFAGVRQTDGYRDQAELDKHTFSGKWFYQASENTEIGVIARYFNYDAQAPGYLTREEARKNPEQSAEYASDDEGTKTTKHLSLHVDHNFSDDNALSLKIYRQQFERERFVRFTASASQQERQEDEKQWGVIVQHGYQINDEWLMQSGFDYHAQDNRHQRFKTVNKKRTAATRDHDFEFINYGAFTQIEHKFSDKLTWIAGVRADKFDGDFVDVISTSKRDIHDYDVIVQPKFSVIAEPNEQVTFFANWGESFQTGIGKGAYAAPGTNFDVSKNTGWEFGTKWQPTSELTLRLSSWQQDASDELVMKTDGSGDFGNIGETERKGWDFAFQWSATKNTYVWGSYTDQQAKLTEPGGNQQLQKGSWLRSVPDYTASFGIDHYLTSNLKGSVYGSYQGNSHISDTNTYGKFGQYSLIDLALDYQADWGNIGLRISNLFDRYYEYVYLLGEEAIYSPGDGRAINVSWSYQF
ncbi:TonB-dependent receptor [Thalassotalea marina]|nr:TonB-dependent receptor [Thalassotalea marina]